MKSKIIALLTVLSINGIYSLQAMHEVGGGGSGSGVMTTGYVNAWRTSAGIAEGNFEPRITHPEPSPSDVAANNERARLLHIRQEEATVRANSFEIIGEEGVEDHTNDDLLVPGPHLALSPTVTDSGLGNSHVASPGASDLDISPTERKALEDEGLPKNFAKDRTWIETEVNKALDEGTVERKAAEKEAQILEEKIFIQKDALRKLTAIRVKNEKLFLDMKIEIAKQIEDAKEDDEISEDEARAKEANLTRLLQEVTIGEITRMKEISDLKLQITTPNSSSNPSLLRYSLNSSLNALSKKELSFYVNAEGETPEFYGKAPAINGYVIQEKPDGTILLWRTKSLNMGRRR